MKMMELAERVAVPGEEVIRVEKINNNGNGRKIFNKFVKNIVPE